MKSKTIASAPVIQTISASTLADNLGTIRAQIGPLLVKAVEIEAELKRRGKGAYEGLLFRVTVSVYSQAAVAWKTIAERLNPSHQLIAAHSSTVEKCRIAVVAKSADKATLKLVH